MLIRKLIGLSAGMVALTMVGCGGDEVVTPPMEEVLDPIAAYTLEGEAATLDLSCLGVSTAPARDGADTNFIFLTADYQSAALLPNTLLHFYPDNVVPADLSCTGTCLTGTSNADSLLPMHGPLGAWTSYYIPARDCSVPNACMDTATTPVTTVQYNIPVPAEGEQYKARTVSLATLNLIPSVLGVTRQGGTGLIAGTFRDCQNHLLQNLVARVFRPDGTFVVAPPRARTAPQYRYFDGNNQPDATQTHSNKDGLFGALNMPIDESGAPVRVEGWGMVDGEMQLIGCEEIRMYEDGVAVLNIYPVRADGPANCGESE